MSKVNHEKNVKTNIEYVLSTRKGFGTCKNKYLQNEAYFVLGF